MVEGVDPKKMCKGVMSKVGQSEDLETVSDPEILVLFEDWLEELEQEMMAAVSKSGSLSAEELAEKLGVSQAGAAFLITKLKREGKI